MAIGARRGEYALNDIVAEDVQSFARAHCQHLRLASFFKFVQSAVGLCNSITNSDHTMVFHEQHGFVTHEAS